MSPKRDRTETQNITICCKRIIALKYSHIFLGTVTLNAIKHFLRVNYTPTCLKIKKDLWANGFKSPALACVSHKFFLNRRGNVNNWVTRAVTLYTNIWVRKEKHHEWTTFNLNNCERHCFRYHVNNFVNNFNC